jgi:hypothetical protein
MSHKLLPRLGSAIASTILSYAAVSFVGVDKAQAAVLTYNFQVEQGGGGGFFKFSDSSLTGIGFEALAVSEGRFNGFTAGRFGSGFSEPTNRQPGKEYYDLVGAAVVFLQGELIGLSASGRDSSSIEFDLPDLPGGPFYRKYESWADWYIYSGGAIIDGIKRSSSSFNGYAGTVISDRNGYLATDGRRFIYDAKVSYTLVNTEAEPVGEPVPEPLTAGGTALALAGLSWLKHKKKMAA